MCKCTRVAQKGVEFLGVGSPENSTHFWLTRVEDSKESISLQGTELHFIRTGRQLSDDVISLPPPLEVIRWLAFPPSLHEYRFVPEKSFFFYPRPNSPTLHVPSELQAPHHDLSFGNDSYLALNLGNTQSVLRYIVPILATDV